MDVLDIGYKGGLQGLVQSSKLKVQKAKHGYCGAVRPMVGIKI
jgi:hypothetical protein